MLQAYVSKITGRIAHVEKDMKLKSFTSLFLSRDTIQSVVALQKAIKDKYVSYDKDDYKRSRMRLIAIDMWNSMQNEFYMSCRISDNTVWKWQDTLESFDDYGYLQVNDSPCDLSDWTVLLKSWFRREWTYEVLRLIHDFNLDTQPSDYVVAFQNDFKRVKTDQEFRSILLKWNDLVYWSPWKLSLYDHTFQKPLPVHFDEEFEPEVENCLELDF